MSASQNPLISFVVLAFNQEKYIRDAVAAAFSQTYSPLEIILSDDGSKDDTFKIMQDMARSYKGPHQVKLNQNVCQSGLGGHIDKVMEITSGELIVLAAGDDISFPMRTQLLFDAWDENGRRATSIYSDYLTFSGKTNANELRSPSFQLSELKKQEIKVNLTSFVRALGPNVYGCTHAFVPRLFSFFGPLTTDVTYEDMALAFRSHAIGSLLHIQAPLIWYRRHEENLSFHEGERPASDSTTFEKLEKREKRRLPGFIKGYERFGRDLSTLVATKQIPNEEASTIERAIARGKKELELKLVLMEGTGSQRIAALWHLKRNGCTRKTFITSAPRCLPHNLYKFLRISKHKYLK